MAQRGRERRRRERRDEALLGEGERDDAAGLGGVGGGGGARDAVPSAGSAVVASQLASAPVGSWTTAALNASSAWPSGVSASAVERRRRSRSASAMATLPPVALGGGRVGGLGVCASRSLGAVCGGRGGALPGLTDDCTALVGRTGTISLGDFALVSGVF